MACIVEGHGEIEAVPALLRRIAGMTSPGVHLQVAKPIRRSKGTLMKMGELESAVELAARISGAGGGILILIDSDEDCPARVGPDLLKRAIEARRDRAIAVVLAKVEFESWFLAGAESLRGRHGLASDLVTPENPESIRGAKEWLSQRMESSRKYTEVLDQPALAAQVDLELARRAPSFDKLYRDVTRMLGQLAGGYDESWAQA